VTVRIAAGADIDLTARGEAGVMSGETAILHASAFGMTDVVDLLVDARALIGSIEEAAAAGTLGGWRSRKPTDISSFAAFVGTPRRAPGVLRMPPALVRSMSLLILPA